MAFTATINSINFQNDQFNVTVTFFDSATSFTSTKIYNFTSNTTQASAVATITADGTVYKNNLIAFNALQSKVGNVITIP